ncbi:hypothetical protein SK3146_02218 [Paenibacillus konkukensis]|uniref:Uncharacterized protein n=1 Tax=Paenibacillus konkukensis TaxID=2020716 RepID=A0ABY4RLW6_9BACL|nr:hypothetical protein SK3146_02218 [Paenibacillus konkukensis]
MGEGESLQRIEKTAPADNCGFAVSGLFEFFP